MRSLRAAAIIGVLSCHICPAVAQVRNVPDCSQKFLAMWLWNREEALKQMPKQPCRLYGETGQYICDRDGCRRP